ncbi:hypothetical protein WISP_00489 [Willisornis vidua]|uniref:Retroviral nucleocapsid Gag protein p24 C-terminal domain-containing protein n=1 Tax=Willisornis vidua TaxID=1566151 RepID=A0ABQ9DVJ3_9PASS|nr:hypothetical protein WISP_00489 [Willisornis vidua]
MVAWRQPTLIIWEQEWRRLAQVEAARPRQAADPLHGLTPEILVGDGAFANVQVQLQYPIEIHYITARLARQAYYAVPEISSSPSFTAVKQGETEPYQHFVDRLYQAIASYAGLGVQEKRSMFHLLALENTNQRTKSLLATLPKTADILEMLEVADRVDQYGHTQAAAELLLPLSGQLKSILLPWQKEWLNPGLV